MVCRLAHKRPVQMTNTLAGAHLSPVSLIISVPSCFYRFILSEEWLPFLSKRVWAAFLLIQFIKVSVAIGI